MAKWQTQDGSIVLEPSRERANWHLRCGDQLAAVSPKMADALRAAIPDLKEVPPPNPNKELARQVVNGSGDLVGELCTVGNAFRNHEDVEVARAILSDKFAIVRQEGAKAERERCVSKVRSMDLSRGYDSSVVADELARG